MHRYTKSCSHCGESFTTDRNATRACSKSCAAFLVAEAFAPLPWLECSKCMAAIGLGMRTAGKLLGHPGGGRVASAWRCRGIERTAPPDGSWDLYARRRGYNQKTKEVKEVTWWGGGEAAQGWISNGKATFPDWSYLWYKELAIRKAKEHYHALSPEEKKARNRRLMDNRTASPEQAEKYKAKSRRWRSLNQGAKREYDRQWREANPGKYKALTRRARKNPKNKAKRNLRDRFRELMQSVKAGGTESFRRIIGCSTAQLQAHLESKFKRGMTWENYGTHWHVDHIIPCAAFDHNKPEQVRQCWHFTNLAPLEAKKNLAKSDKITAPQLSLLLSA